MDTGKLVKNLQIMENWRETPIITPPNATQHYNVPMLITKTKILINFVIKIIKRQVAMIQRNTVHFQTYARLRQPETLNTWLLDLGLPCYIQTFLDNGWDQLKWIKDMSEQDLVDMGIKNPEHRERILSSVRDMMSQPRCYSTSFGMTPTIQYNL